MNNPIVEYSILTEKLNLWYGTFQALIDVDLQIKKGMITSLIGPSGCGKTTLLRCFNRINERLGYVRTEGKVEIMGSDIYDESVELAQLRKEVGMVFQRPNPLPISIIWINSSSNFVPFGAIILKIDLALGRRGFHGGIRNPRWARKPIG